MAIGSGHRMLIVPDNTSAIAVDVARILQRLRILAEAHGADFKSMGSCFQFREQVHVLLQMGEPDHTRHENKNICEIGLNAGHSAALMLSALPLRVRTAPLLLRPRPLRRRRRLPPRRPLRILYLL